MPIPQPPSDEPNWRCELIRMVQDGNMDAETLAQMVARWMTSEDIYRMLDLNEWSPRFKDN